MPTLPSALSPSLVGLPRSPTLARFLDFWLAHVAWSQLRFATARTYSSVVIHLLAPALGRIRVSRLAPSDLEKAQLVWQRAGVTLWMRRKVVVSTLRWCHRSVVQQSSQRGCTTRSSPSTSRDGFRLCSRDRQTFGSYGMIPRSTTSSSRSCATPHGSRSARRGGRATSSPWRRDFSSNSAATVPSMPTSFASCLDCFVASTRSFTEKR